MNLVQAHIYRGDSIPPEAHTKPLFISSCGHYVELNQALGAIRPEGRSDYQLLFVTEGYIYVKNCDGSETPIGAGSIAVFKPGMRQVYLCNPQENTSYYWVHFGGTQAESLLEQVGLSERFCYTNINFEDNLSSVYNMISEIRLRRKNYELQCCLHFCTMLNIICRDNSGASTSDSDIMRLMPALNAMERQMQTPYTIEDYAKMCLMSSCHFMHIFKKCTGFTAMQYKNRLTMERAKYLLTHSSMSVAEIALAVGFEDSAYFSKKFRSYFGFSPGKCRKA